MAWALAALRCLSRRPIAPTLLSPRATAAPLHFSSLPTIDGREGETWWCLSIFPKPRGACFLTRCAAGQSHYRESGAVPLCHVPCESALDCASKLCPHGAVVARLLSPGLGTTQTASTRSTTAVAGRRRARRTATTLRLRPASRRTTRGACRGISSGRSRSSSVSGFLRTR